MDADNFEFRPLTKGLGFDKSTGESQQTPRVAVTRPQVHTKLPERVQQRVAETTKFEMPEQSFEVTNNTPVSRSLKKMLDSLPPSVDFAEDKDRELRLARTERPEPTPFAPPIFTPEKAPAPAPQQNFDVTLNNSLSQAFPKEEVSKRFYHQLVTPIPQYKEVSSSFASAIIDAMIILGLSSLFVITLVAITKVDLLRMIMSQEMSTRTFVELGLLYFGVTLLYFMLARGLFGSTLGDWAFDVQLGSEEERRHMGYPVQVIFRTFVVLISGVILLPLASVLFGKDLAYYVSGLKLYSRQY